MNRFHVFVALASVLATFLYFGPAQAQSAERIVAVVNNQIITYSELAARTELNARVMRLPELNEANRAVLMRRTLGELVDEQLQLQHAEGLGLALNKSEFQAAKDEARANLGEAEWQRLSQGVSAAADGKVRAEATWARLRGAVVRPRVQMGTLEIDRLIEDMSRNKTREELNINMILLTPGEGESPAAVDARAEKVYTEAAAANTAEAFAELAKTHSSAGNAHKGGAMGWVSLAEIPPAIAQAAQGLKANEITKPIRIAEGLLILRVNETRAQSSAISVKPRTEYQLYLLAAAAPSETAVRQELVKTLTSTVRETKDTQAVLELLQSDEALKTFNLSATLGWVQLEALQPDVRAAVEKTKVGSWTNQLDAPNQLSRIFVADTRRVMPPETLALRERIATNLMNNRVELEARKLMRDLRARAFIDIRL